MTVKTFRSPDYNYNFNVESGYFERWGRKVEDDPDFSPFGPEIADIEISSASPDDLLVKYMNYDHNIVTEGGCNGLGCKKFCYKGNTSNRTIHMTIELFKEIMDRMIFEVKVKLENGKLLTLKPFDKVKLTDGTVKYAHKLTENDDFLEKVSDY